MRTRMAFGIVSRWRPFSGEAAEPPEAVPGQGEGQDEVDAGFRPLEGPVPAGGLVGDRDPMLHDAPLPPWPGRSLEEIASEFDGECEWLITNGVLSADLVTRNRRVAEAALRPWAPVFTHGDLQVAHVFVDGDKITGVVDWSEAGRGDALYDLAGLRGRRAEIPAVRLHEPDGYECRSAASSGSSPEARRLPEPGCQGVA